MDVCVFFRTGMLTGQLVYAMVQYLWLPGTPMVTLDLPHRMRWQPFQDIAAVRNMNFQQDNPS